MSKYLLDTNICVYFLKGKHNLHRIIEAIGLQNCCISEITVAELKFGVENSERKEDNRKILEAFLHKFAILPIYNCLDIYAKEKARLQKKGITIDEFDLLIGCTAIANELVMVTNNEKHFTPLSKIRIENWVAKS